MAKKHLGLACVTALGGFVCAVAAAGCSSTNTYFVLDDGGTESSAFPKEPAQHEPDPPPEGPHDASPPPDAEPPVDAGPKPKTDAGPDGAAGTCPTTDPITAADIDAQLAWKAPAPFQTVCTQANIDAAKLLFKSPPAGGVKYADIKTSLGATCAACAFSPVSGATWQVFVEQGGGAVDNRTGSCFAIRRNATCGQARFRWETCLNAACPESDCGAGGVAACITKAQQGACFTLTTSYAAACPNEATDVPICANIFGSIATACSGGPGNTINVN